MEHLEFIAPPGDPPGDLAEIRAPMLEGVTRTKDVCSFGRLRSPSDDQPLDRAIVSDALRKQVVVNDGDKPLSRVIWDDSAERDGESSQLHHEGEWFPFGLPGETAVWIEGKTVRFQPRQTRPRRFYRCVNSSSPRRSGGRLIGAVDPAPGKFWWWTRRARSTCSHSWARRSRAGDVRRLERARRLGDE